MYALDASIIQHKKNTMSKNSEFTLELLQDQQIIIEKLFLATEKSRHLLTEESISLTREASVLHKIFVTKMQDKIIDITKKN